MVGESVYYELSSCGRLLGLCTCSTGTLLVRGCVHVRAQSCRSVLQHLARSFGELS